MPGQDSKPFSVRGVSMIWNVNLKTKIMVDEVGMVY